MIKELKISNFKSIKEQSFEFKPLVILTGTNSSGKSSILHAILLTSDNRTSRSLQKLTRNKKNEAFEGEHPELYSSTARTAHPSNNEVFFDLLSIFD